MLFVDEALPGWRKSALSIGKRGRGGGAKNSLFKYTVHLHLAEDFGRDEFGGVARGTASELSCPPLIRPGGPQWVADDKHVRNPSPPVCEMAPCSSKAGHQTCLTTLIGGIILS
jgi:hypothetical protein